MLKNKNGIFYVVISLVAVFGVASVLYAYTLSQSVNVAGDYNYYEAVGQPEENTSLGAFSGPDIYNDINIHGSLTLGSSHYIATTTNTETLSFQDLNLYTYFDMLPNASSITVTFPATSTLNQILSEVGSSRRWVFHNATTTAAKTITLAAGTGVDFISSSSTLIINDGAWATVDCVRVFYRSAVNVDVACLVEPATDL